MLAWAWIGFSSFAAQAVANGGYQRRHREPEVLDMGRPLGKVPCALICYEAIFPQYLRQVQTRPDLAAAHDQ